MKRFAWVVALLVTAVGAFAALSWFADSRDLVEVEHEVGLHGEAAANPWLGLERFLVAMRIPTESRTTLLELPPHDSALLLLSPRRALGPDRTRRIVAWVEEGGTLLLAPVEQPRSSPTRPSRNNEGFNRRDFLLEELEIEIRGGEISASIAPVRFLEPRREFTVEYSERAILVKGGQEVLWRCEDTGSRSACGPVALQVRCGRGNVIVLADKAPLENLALGKHDHAAFAWEVLSHLGAPSRAWIVRADEPSGIWRRLTHEGWPFLVGLAIVIALWLWRSSLRIGPVRDLPDAERRSLEEHLLAAGRFAWRTDQGKHLLEPLRDAVRTRLRRRHPELTHATHAKRSEVLATWTGLPIARIRAALEATPASSSGHEAFVTLVRDLQRIHQHT